MAKSRFVSLADIRLGAIYRFGLSRRLSAKAISQLLVERCRFTERQATQLVGHWLASEPYRLSAKASA